MNPLKTIASFIEEFFREGAEGKPVHTRMEIEDLYLKNGKLVIISKTTVLDDEIK